MKQADANKYIKKLGLEKNLNTLIQMRTNQILNFTTENELSRFASKIVYDLTHTPPFAGSNYKITLYILRADGTAQFCFHDENGIYPTPNLPLYVVKEHANLFTRDNYYVLMVETKENCFSLVS